MATALDAPALVDQVSNDFAALLPALEAVNDGMERLAEMLRASRRPEAAELAAALAGSAGELRKLESGAVAPMCRFLSEYRSQILSVMPTRRAA